jgi:hypothetical protein
MTNHATDDILINELNKIDIIVGDEYYHYKNPDKYYQILAIAINEENEKPMVVYKALYGKNLIWVRSYDLWSEIINFDGKFVTRFSKKI